MIQLILALVIQTPDQHDQETLKLVLSSNKVAIGTPTRFVELVGVGVPETVDPEKPSSLVGKSDLGWLNHHLKPGDKILVKDLGKSRVLLCRTDGFDWGRWLVSVGGAYYRRTPLVDYSSEEAKAKDARLGIWASLPRKPDTSYKTVTIQKFGDLKNYPDHRHQPKRYIQQPDLVGQMTARMLGSLNNAAIQSLYTPPPLMGVGPPINIGGPRLVNPNQQQIGGYTRSDGTPVRGYTRTQANETTLDNLRP